MGLDNTLLGRTMAVLNTHTNHCFVGELVSILSGDELGENSQMITLKAPAIFDPEKGVICKKEYTIAHNMVEYFMIPAELRAHLKKALPENTIRDTHLKIVMKNEKSYKRSWARRRAYLKLEMIEDDSDGKNTSLQNKI